MSILETLGMREEVFKRLVLRYAEK